MFHSKELKKGEDQPISIKICLICGKEDELDFGGRPMRFTKLKINKNVNCAELACRVLSLPMNPKYEFKLLFTKSRYCRECNMRLCELELDQSSMIGKDSKEFGLSWRKLMEEFRRKMTGHLSEVSKPSMSDETSKEFKRVLKMVLDFDPASVVEEKPAESDDYDSDPFEDKLFEKIQKQKKRKANAKAKAAKDPAAPTTNKRAKRGRNANTSDDKDFSAPISVRGTTGRGRKTKNSKPETMEEILKELDETEPILPISLNTSMEVETLTPDPIVEPITTKTPLEDNNMNGSSTTNGSSAAVDADVDADAEEITIEKSDGEEDPANPYKCPVCKEKFHVEVQLDKHCKKFHKNVPNPFICEYEACGKAYSSLRSLSGHKKRYHESSSFICGFCGLDCKMKFRLNEHLDNHPEYKPLNCQYCGRTFKRDFSLQVAFQMHKGGDVDPCVFCGKRIPKFDNKS